MPESKTTKDFRGFFKDWTDEMIINHFAQSRTKQDIEEIIGRAINWKEPAV